LPHKINHKKPVALKTNKNTWTDMCSNTLKEKGKGK